MKIAQRNFDIAPFYVMEVAKAADKLSKEIKPGEKEVIQLTLGEPDFEAPALVQEAAFEAIRRGRTHYTVALGLNELRKKISGWYKERFGIDVPSERIIVTAGASAALHLACSVLVDPGRKVIMSDPCYPCNRHFVRGADGIPKSVPVFAEERFQLSAEKVREAWDSETSGVLLASPSNPTGTSIAPRELKEIFDFVSSKEGFTIVDELYLGLSHDPEFGMTALKISDRIISINSFSKYFSMTGWRLGWIVVPEELVPAFEAQAQNFYICPSAISQYAALSCFEPESIKEYERRRFEFKKRRDFFVKGLGEVGMKIPVMPDGAFYVWADVSPLFEKLGVDNSWDFVFSLMDKTHVAVSPGKDFGINESEKFVRFSIANSMENLQEAIRRFRKLFI